MISYSFIIEEDEGSQATRKSGKGFGETCWVRTDLGLGILGS